MNLDDNFKHIKRDETDFSRQRALNCTTGLITIPPVQNKNIIVIGMLYSQLIVR